MTERHATVAAVVLAAALAASPATRADEVADFYKGKTVTILVGYGANSGYDFYARLVSHHLGRLLPGEPNIIVKNMGGAGGLRATNFLYNAAPQDGSMLGAVGRGHATEELVFGERARGKFDAQKFHWLGSLNAEASIAAAWHTAGVASLADAKAKSIYIPTGGTGSDSGVFTLLSNVVLGTQFKLICCYPGGGEQNLALERGEVQGRSGWSWSSVKTEKPDWIRDGKLKLLYQYALKKHPELQHVPLITELVADPADRKMIEIVMVRQEMGRPYLAPPGTPQARVAALRTAFDRMLADPAFRAEAERSKLEIVNPMSGAEIDALLKDAFAAPKPVLERLRLATQPKAADVWHKYKQEQRGKKGKAKE